MCSEQSISWPEPGPLELGEFPDTLSARVVTPGPHPCIHGYDVETDLSVHYSATEITFLALTGQLPAVEVGAALDIAVAFLAPVSVAQAPAHAAVLSRLCGAPASSVLSVAALGLAEQARYLLDEHEEFLEWLFAQTAALPQKYCSHDETERLAVRHLGDALARVGFRASALNHNVTRQAAVLAVLVECGLTARHQLEVVLVWSRLPTVMAEAMAEAVGNFSGYPANLPRFVYVEAES